MCGIAGAWLRNTHGGGGEACVRRMTEAMTHRGPDDGNVMRAGAGGERELWLGHSVWRSSTSALRRISRCTMP